MMRFKILLVSTLILIQTIGYSQEEDYAKFKIDPYIGLLPGDVWASTGIYLKPSNAKNTGLPIGVGLRTELRFSARIGLRVEANYVNIGYSQINESSVTVYDESTMENSVITTEWLYERNSEKLRAMLGFNFYLTSNESLDIYFALAAGYRYINRTHSYDGVRSNYQGDIILPSTPFPLSMRMGVGFRSYFSDQVGISGELGMGGGTVLQLGLAFRL